MVIDSLAAIDVFKKRKLLLWAILGGSIEGIKAVFVLSDDRDDAGKLYRKLKFSNLDFGEIFRIFFRIFEIVEFLKKLNFFESKFDRCLNSPE